MSSHFVSKPTLTSRPPSGRKATRQCCPDLLSSSTTCINWRQHYGNQGHFQCHWNDVLGNYWIDWFLHCFVSPQIINATMRVKKSLPKTTKRTTLAQMIQRKDRQTDRSSLPNKAVKDKKPSSQNGFSKANGSKWRSFGVTPAITWTKTGLDGITLANDWERTWQCYDR